MLPNVSRWIAANPKTRVSLKLATLYVFFSLTSSVMDSTTAGENIIPKDAVAAKAEAAEVKLTPEQIKLVEIKTAIVKAAPVTVELILNAEVTANQDKTGQVLSKTSGVISSIKKHLGDQVKAGETLAVIASRELAEFEAAYTTAKAKADFAKAQLAREESLWKQKATSEQEFLSAKATANETAAELGSAEQKLKLLEPKHTNTPEHKDQSSTGVPVTAPFDGTIIEKKVALGDQVNDQSPLFKIADLDTVWVIANVFEKDLERVAVGQAASVSVRASVSTACAVLN